MDDNTRFLRAILRKDWESFDTLVAEFERQGKGTPVAIIGFAFNLAVNRRFGARKDMSEIIRFVADARVFLSEGENLPPREAEALVCANLDIDKPWVEKIVEDLDPGTIALYEGQLLYKLVKDANLAGEQLDALLAEAENRVAQWSNP